MVIHLRLGVILALLLPSHLLALEFDVPVQVPVGDQPWSMAAGELVGDARTDVVVGTVLGELLLLEGTEYGSGLEVAHAFTGNYPKANVAVGDFDGDGDNDIVVSYEVFDGDQIAVFAQQSDGTFEQSQEFLEIYLDNLFVSDLNLDGASDLVGAALDSVVVFLGGPGLLQDRQPLCVDLSEGCDFFGNSVSFDVADMNGDEHLDIICTTRADDDCGPLVQGVGLFAGDGTGAVADVEWILLSSDSPSKYRGTRVAHLNADEFPDFVVMAGDSARVFHGVDTGAWLNVGGFVPWAIPTAFVLEDFDNDGLLDLVGGTPYLFHRSAGIPGGIFEQLPHQEIGFHDVSVADVDMAFGPDLIGIDYDGYVSVARNISHLAPASVPSPRKVAGLCLELPNPAMGVAHTTLHADRVMRLEVSVLDAAGRVQFVQRVTASRGATRLNIHGLGPSGLRVLRVEDETGAAWSRKFVWRR